MVKEMYKTFRLTRGMDLKREIEKYVIDNEISGVILSSVGSISKLTIRLADGKSILEKEEDFEIISVNGTLSKDGLHLHISVSDINGNLIGGHLKDGTIINTTCEIVLLIFDDVKYTREYDENTGFNELAINEIK